MTTLEALRAVQVADCYRQMWRSMRREAFLDRVSSRALSSRIHEEWARIAMRAANAEERDPEPRP